MQPRRCLFSPSRALRSVFLPTYLEATSTARPPFYLLSPRLFSTTTPQLYIRSRSKPTGAGGPKQARLPSDNAIPYRWVRIADCHAHGLQPEKEDSTSDLSAPQRTADILKGLNRQKYSLVMVAVPSRRRAPAEREEEDEDESLQAQAEKERQSAPVCRIMDKFAFAKAAEEKEKAARQKELNRKELELNWAIAPNDLQHRLKQFRDFLEKGKRVELMLAKKKRGRKATKEEGDTLVAALKETAEGVGAKQVKIDGKFPGIVNMVFEGKVTEKTP